MPQVAVCGGCKREFQSPESCRGHQIQAGRAVRQVSPVRTRMCVNAGIQMRWVEVAQEHDIGGDTSDDVNPTENEFSQETRQ